MTAAEISACSRVNLTKSSRRTKFTWHGCSVSAVSSYGPPETAAFRPNTSPGSQIPTIKVFPSDEFMVSFTRPLHNKYTPRDSCPSTNSTASPGYVVVNFTLLNAWSADDCRWQKKASFRMGQVLQSSVSSIPYGACMVTLLLPHSSDLLFVRVVSQDFR